MNGIEDGDGDLYWREEFQRMTEQVDFSKAEPQRNQYLQITLGILVCVGLFTFLAWVSAWSLHTMEVIDFTWDFRQSITVGSLTFIWWLTFLFFSRATDN